MSPLWFSAPRYARSLSTRLMLVPAPSGHCSRGLWWRSNLVLSPEARAREYGSRHELERLVPVSESLLHCSRAPTSPVPRKRWRPLITVATMPSTAMVPPQRQTPPFDYDGIKNKGRDDTR